MKYSIQEYLKTAGSTETFTPDEIAVLREVLEDVLERPGKDYQILEKDDPSGLKGFLIYGSTPMTEKAFDLYWIAVNKSAQREGTGRQLVLEMEKQILEKKGTGIIRIETSGGKKYEGQRKFYLSLGYSECGRIKDFYRNGDDLVTYCKSIFR